MALITCIMPYVIMVSIGDSTPLFAIQNKASTCETSQEMPYGHYILSIQLTSLNSSETTCQSESRNQRVCIL
jgi:hypothetical protein